MIETILLPVDLDNRGRKVIAFGAGTKSLGVKRAVVVHVVEPTGTEHPVIDASIDESLIELRGMVEPLHDAGLEVELRVPVGEPYREILGMAAVGDIDGIVCGSHGKGVIDEILIGSISERIIQMGRSPVLVARFGLLNNYEDPSVLSAQFGQKALMAIDFSDASMRAFETVEKLGGKAIGSLTLLHVIDRMRDDDRRRRRDEEAVEKLRELCDRLKAAKISATFAVRHGDPVREILSQVNDRRATGVIVGSRGINFVREAIVGSVSRTVLRQASCPVLVIP